MTQAQIARNLPVRRAIAVVAVGVLGSLAVAHTLAYQIRSENSGLALGLAPYDGRIAALAAAYQSKPDANSADRKAGDALARLALRQDPTVAVAASTIGLNAQVSDNVAGARRLFTYAEFLSRREMQTQLWAIEDAVGSGDVVDALRHYDIVLRAKPNLSQMLFPTLMSASSDPEIRVPLIKTLSSNPPWGQSFITYVASMSSAPRSTAQLLTELRGEGIVVSDEARANLIGSLLNAGFVDEAWSYYSTLRKEADRRKSRDPRFTSAMDPPSPFDWIISNDEGVSASIQRGANHGILDFVAPSMIGGPIIQQVQALPAGRYQLQGHALAIKHSADDSPYWSLKCKTGNEIGRVDILKADQGDGKFAGTFTVPPQCPIQILSLVARPSDDIAGISGQIDYVQLQPGS